MLEIIPAPEGVVAMRVSGRLDRADIDRSIDAVEAALTRHGRIALFADVTVTGISPEALWRDLSYGLGKLGELHRFPRTAIVTGQDWVRWITQAEGALLPGVEMRAFPEAERESAWSWITGPLPAENPGATEQRGPAVSFVATTRPDVVAFEVNGRLTAADARELLRVFNEAMADHDRLRILVLMVLSTWREVGAAGADIAITPAPVSLPRQHRSHRARNPKRHRGRLGTHWRKGDDGGVGSGCGSQCGWREIAGPAGRI